MLEPRAPITTSQASPSDAINADSTVSPPTTIGYGGEDDAQLQASVNIQNKLKEGWDVTNLYTIVPLRASASDILTEQTLGRGLRLPSGRGGGAVARAQAFTSASTRSITFATLTPSASAR